MTDEQQQLLQKLYTEQQLTEQNMSLYQQQLEIVQALIRNYQSGLLILQEMEGKKADEEMLIEVGGKIFFHAKLVDTSKVIRGIGRTVRIEQSMEEAKSALESQIESLGNQYETLLQEYEKLAARAAALNNQFEQLAAQIQGVAGQSKEE
ncbi:MAG: prefoldin subunit alpha [Candidatus Thorarchaeota archaeon]|nr:MAG: prefoldin subunit alpha [Candidatus Thorarchaeota archaeon]RLI58914.1 MAG: prefoldin subunit alpha [Candidatus Thorarchaeota archaeon]